MVQENEMYRGCLKLKCTLLCLEKMIRCRIWFIYSPSNLFVKYRLKGTFRNFVWQEREKIILKEQTQKQIGMRKYSSGQNSQNFKI